MEERGPDLEDDDWVGECPRCQGAGVILICPDDICRGAGECMHGDGEIVCPEPGCLGPL